MYKINTYEKFLNETQLYSKVSDVRLISDVVSYMIDPSLNESSGFIDNIKNKISKNFLGSLSHIKMIDSLVDKLAMMEREAIKKSYSYEDALDSISLQMEEARRKRDPAMVKSLRRRMDRKRSEFDSYMKSQKIKIKKGIELIEKAVDRKTRRREYAKLKLSDKDYEIAQFEYDYAKKMSSEPEEVDKLKQKYEEARKKVEEMISDFSSFKDDSKEIDILEIDPKKEKENISKRGGESVIERKSKLEKEISRMKEILKKELDGLLSDMKTKPERSVSLSTSDIKKKLIALSNSIDSSSNLLDLYKSLGKTEKGIENKIEKESNFTKIVNKINSTISDGKDSESGTTKYVLDFFNKYNKNPKENSLMGLVKKISQS